MDQNQCSHLLNYLSDYVNGELSESLCLELEAHMANCENCRVVVDTLAMTLKLYHESPAPTLPEDVRSRLYASLDLSDFLGKPGE